MVEELAVLRVAAGDEHLLGIGDIEPGADRRAEPLGQGIGLRAAGLDAALQGRDQVGFQVARLVADVDPVLPGHRRLPGHGLRPLGGLTPGLLGFLAVVAPVGAEDLGLFSDAHLGVHAAPFQHLIHCTGHPLQP